MCNEFPILAQNHFLTSFYPFRFLSHHGLIPSHFITHNEHFIGLSQCYITLQKVFILKVHGPVTVECPLPSIAFHCLPLPFWLEAKSIPVPVWKEVSKGRFTREQVSKDSFTRRKNIFHIFVLIPTCKVAIIVIPPPPSPPSSSSSSFNTPLETLTYGQV